MIEERYCAHCGSRPEGSTCCWYVDGEETEPQPHRLVPGKAWAEWSGRQRSLILLLMERFGGAAEEWELLCRLPWPQRWLLDCAGEAWSHWPEPGLMFPCLREKEARGIRYYLTDMARDAYTAHRRAEAVAAGQRERLGTW
jgi:hypothetical protein